MMDWFTKLFYLGCILAVLILGALALYLVFLIFGTQDDVDELETLKSSYKRRSSKCKHCLNKSLSSGPNLSLDDRRNQLMQQTLFDAEGNQILMVNPRTQRQTMFSSLKQSAKDSDVILATALSSIPLKELGGSNNDIVVDVSQQIHFDKDNRQINSENFKCIFCRSGVGKITWNQVKCFAQTTIGVLVLNRTAPKLEDQKPTTESTSVHNPRDSVETPDAIRKHKTVSNVSLGPVPDSRIAIKQQHQQQEQQPQPQQQSDVEPLDGSEKGAN